MKKIYLFLFTFLLIFGISSSVKALEPKCTKEAVLQISKIVYHEVGGYYNPETGNTNDLFAQLTTASIILNNASSKAGTNWYEKLLNLTDNNYSSYSSYKNLSFDTVVTSNKGRMLYVAELVLTGKYNVPKTMVFQAARSIVQKEGRVVWTYVPAYPMDVYFGYEEHRGISDVDIFGRTVQSKDADWYRNFAKSFEKSNYDEYTLNTVCGGLTDDITGDPSNNTNSNNDTNNTNNTPSIDIPFCENPDALKVIYFGKIILGIVRIVIPIGLVIMAMLDFSKGVSSESQEDNKKILIRLGKRILIAVLIFLVPWIVNLLIKALDTLTKDVNYMDCINNAEGNKIQELEANIKNNTNNNSSNNNNNNSNNNNNNNSNNNNNNNSNNNNNNNSSTSYKPVNFAYSKIIFVGDSRTTQMCTAVEDGGNATTCSFKGNGNKPFVSGNTYYVAEGGQGYRWFRDTAISAVNDIVSSSNDRYAIVSLIGVNGLDSTNFINKYRELLNTYWSDSSRYYVILVSVMPVIESRMEAKGYDISITNNTKIEEFNKKLSELAASGISNHATYCDIYTIMKNNLNLYELDSGGLHFTTEGYKEIYRLIEETCF